MASHRQVDMGFFESSRPRPTKRTKADIIRDAQSVSNMTQTPTRIKPNERARAISGYFGQKPTWSCSEIGQ